MHATLLVPDLVWPHRGTAGVGLDAPALRELARRGSFERAGATSALDWLCDRFRLPNRAGERPFAPCALAADGVDPGSRYWLRADPVHLRPDRDTLVLMPRAALALDAAETAQLVADVNAYLSGDPETAALRLVAPHPARWYLGLADAPRLFTTPVGHVEGANTADALPRGEDARRWHRLINELQMLLHGHPVNAARAARGALTVNSVWLWGGGRRAAPTDPPDASVAGEDEIARALALSSGVAALAGFPDAEAWLAALPPGPAHLAVLDRLVDGARREDGEAWQAAVAALERDWFAPLRAALDAGRLASLEIVGPGPATVRVRVRRGQRWRGWRRGPSLARLLGPDPDA